jgi:hypothetical protein
MNYFGVLGLTNKIIICNRHIVANNQHPVRQRTPKHVLPDYYAEWKFVVSYTITTFHSSFLAHVDLLPPPTSGCRVLRHVYLSTKILQNTISFLKRRPIVFLKSNKIKLIRYVENNLQQLKYQINVVRYIWKYIFLWYLYSVTIVDIF